LDGLTGKSKNQNWKEMVFLSDLIDLMDDFKDRRGRFQVNAKQGWLKGRELS
jgi:hypothetical protein